MFTLSTLRCCLRFRRKSYGFAIDFREALRPKVGFYFRPIEPVELRLHQHDGAQSHNRLRQHAEHEQREAIGGKKDPHIAAGCNRFVIDRVVEIHELDDAQIIESADERSDGAPIQPLQIVQLVSFDAVRFSGFE